MEHPLPNGTFVIANIICHHCHIGDPPENHRRVKIRNHVVQDGQIMYRVTSSNFMLKTTDIIEVISE